MQDKLHVTICILDGHGVEPFNYDLNYMPIEHAF